ncbi:MAG: hypothetical protein ACR2H4_18825 [Pyrinomonadaceae bacterium]
MKNLLLINMALRFRKYLWFLIAVLGLGPALATNPIDSFGAAQRTQETMQSTQRSEIESLRDVIRNERLRREQPKQVIAAIKRLGELKAASAVDDLVNLLTFRQTFDFETKDAINEIRLITPGDRYPATSAFFQIGRPSLPALIKVIEAHKAGSIESENSIYAVTGIFRENLSEGTAYLRNAAAKSPRRFGSQRLLTAASRIEEMARKSGK